jgi:hypothetical protein
MHLGACPSSGGRDESDSPLRHEQTFSSLDNYQTQLLPAAVVDYVPADHLAQFRRRLGARALGSVGDRRKLQKLAWSVSRSDRDIDRQVQLDKARLQQRHGQVIMQLDPSVGIAWRSPKLLEDHLAGLS